VAGFQVGSNVSIHSRPVIALKKSFFSFVDAIVPNKFVSMGIQELVVSKRQVGK
jgi:hypothetical protein